MSAFRYRQYIIKFYNKTAIIRDNASFEKIIALLEGIEQYQFCLTLNSSLLNSWSNSTLMLAGYWTPALKNNPLCSNTNSQLADVAEALDASSVYEPALKIDKSEDSYTSSVSSSFVDTDLFYKPSVSIDEDISWNLIMKQASTSFKTFAVTENTDLVEVVKENTSDHETDVVIKSNDNIVSKNEEPKHVVQSFNDLLMSYNLRVKSSTDSPKVDDLFKQLTDLKTIEQPNTDHSENLDDVS